MVEKRLRGRPLKYGPILEVLDDDRCFTPSLIVQFAEEKGLLDETGFLAEDIARFGVGHVKRRIRITLGRLSHHRRFPPDGDGLVTWRGQPMMVGWKGSRWKHVLDAASRS